MEKTFYPDDHHSLLEAAGGMKFQLFDPSSKHQIKSASEGIDRKTIAEHMPDDDHFLLHVIAMGADETYGWNRNGDGFSKSALAKYHPTFVTNGHFYREHRNRCPETQGIGMIKHSAYNEPMSRVELLVWGDKRKAEEEYEMAKSGSELSFSMSARLPGDECAACGNFARNLGHYCDHLRNHMGMYIPSMKKYAYAKNNKDVVFYDISRVGKPADRIAHYLAYKFGEEEGMAKAASTENIVIPGAEWAAFEGVNLEKNLVNWDVHEEAMLNKLAKAEENLNNWNKQAGELSDVERTMVSQVAPSAVSGYELEQEDITLIRDTDVDLPGLFGELCKSACILPFLDYASLITGMTKQALCEEPQIKRIIRIRIPMMFGQAAEHGCGCDDAAGLVSPAPEGLSFTGNKDMLEGVMRKVEDSMGMEDDQVKNRATKVVIIKKASYNEPEEADIDPFYTSLLDTYTTYVVKSAAFINRYTNVGAEMLPDVVVAMNRK